MVSASWLLRICGELEPTRNGEVFWKNNNLRDTSRKHAEIVCTASSETIPQECTAQSFSFNGKKLENLKMTRRRAVETVVSFLDSFYYSRETCMTNFKIISHLLSHWPRGTNSYPFIWRTTHETTTTKNDIQVIYSLPLVEKHWINAWHVNHQTLYNLRYAACGKLKREIEYVLINAHFLV